MYVWLASVPLLWACYGMAERLVDCVRALPGPWRRHCAAGVPRLQYPVFTVASRLPRRTAPCAVIVGIADMFEMFVTSCGGSGPALRHLGTAGAFAEAGRDGERRDREAGPQARRSLRAPPAAGMRRR